MIWLNRTGIFGVALAAYWFSRLIGLVGGLAFRVLSDFHLHINLSGRSSPGERRMRTMAEDLDDAGLAANARHPLLGP